MKLKGERLLIPSPDKETKTESGLVLPEGTKLEQEYSISHVGDAVDDPDLVVGARVIVADAIIARSEEIKIGDKRHKIITPTMVVAVL